MTPPSIALASLSLLSSSLLLVPADASLEQWQVPKANARIAFTVTTKNGSEDIHVINGDGTGRSPLITSRAQRERHPAWSATSEELLFSTVGSIWRASVDGSERTRLTHLDGLEERPRWSPDGTTILFTYTAVDTEEVMVMPVDGGAATNLTSHPARDSQAEWSPDGSRIVFTTSRLGDLDLFVMDADGTDPQPLVAGAGLQRHGAWSPDGKRLVFDSTNGRGETDIFVANADGSDITQLTFDPGHDREPAWSPDGSKIVFTSDRAGNDDLYVMDPDGSDVVRLTNDPADERRPDWGSVRSVGVLDTLGEEGNGGAALEFYIGLSVIHDTPVSVDWATSAGSAAEGLDYEAKSGTATIPAGAFATQVSVPVLADDLDEVDESVSLTLTNPSGATMSRAGAVGTIADDDPSPVLSVADAAVVETPGGSVATFDLTLSTVSGRDVTVAYATEEGTALGAADYEIGEGTATVSAGALSTTVTIPVLDDALDELSESFDLVLSAPGGAELPDPTGTATITDDDDPPTLSVGDTAVAEGDGGSTTASVPIELSVPSGRDIEVTYATSDGGAKAPLDYEAAGGTVVVPPGTVEVAIEVPVVGDDIDEPDESFDLSVASAEGATLVDAVGTATIVDDDPEPVVSVSDATVEEGGTAEVEISLSQPSGRQVSVDLLTVNGSAVAPGDYESVRKSISIPAGDTRASLSVVTAEDVLDEPDELFDVTLSGSSGGAIGDATGRVSIVDDDPPPQVSLADATAGESAPGAVFTVSLSSPSGLPVSISYATANLTATAGRDYERALGTLDIPPGQTSATITIALLQDGFDEADETFALLISSARGATIGDGEAVGTIADDDEPPPPPAQPSISIADSSGGEGQPSMAFTVTLSEPSSTHVAVDFATANGTAVAGRDYGRADSTLQIPAGQTSGTVTISLLGDLVDEPDETFIVVLSSPKGAVLADDQAIGTILDDDP